jgi:hypothetical protein
MDKIYYTIYKITNQINGKIYIGSHKTKDLNDNYMGSGKYLKYAKEKHGMENFTKQILFVFDTAEQMYAKEAEIVNEEFLALENTYNLKVGGFGGWDYLNNWEDNPSHSIAHMTKMSNQVSLETKRKISQLGIQKYKEMFEANGNKIWWEAPRAFAGKVHSEETKKKIGESVSKAQSGSKNSQFGTMWITNDIENKKISKQSTIPYGWRRGRICKC